MIGNYCDRASLYEARRTHLFVELYKYWSANVENALLRVGLTGAIRSPTVQGMNHHSRHSKSLPRADGSNL